MEGIYSILIIILVFGIGIFVNVLIAEDKKEQEQKILKDTKVVDNVYAIHIGGHPHIKQNFNMHIQITNKDFLYLDTFIPGTVKKIKIPYSDIVECRCQNQENITKDVTVARLLTLGVFAFVFKKEKNKPIGYLILSYMLEGVKIDCVFKANNIQQLNQFSFNLNKTLLRYKNKDFQPQID